MKGIYLVGGYPENNKFAECVEVVEQSGFDFIEVGIPFNDPIADGPIIAGALNDSLINGATVDGLIDKIIELKRIKLKKYIMTYSNIIYSYGIKKFSNRLREYLDGIIVADLPNRMSNLFYENGFEIPIVPFATLETRDSDIKKIKNSKSEFIYFIGLRGITGSKADFTSPEIISKITLLKKHTEKKIIIGFGIKTYEDVKHALNIGDGFVVGTEAVKRQNDSKALHKYLDSLMK